MVVGLDPEVIPFIVKQIQSQAGVQCSVGVLDSDEWSKRHGSTVEPLAEPGSPIMTFEVAAVEDTISGVLSHIEKVVPPKNRRYLRESLEEARGMDSNDKGKTIGSDAAFGDGQESNDALNPENGSSDDDSPRNMVDESLVEALKQIYCQHAPEKEKDLPLLLQKYSGREKKLLEAVQRKYLQSAGQRVEPEASPVIKTGGGTSVNVVDDFMADDGTDEPFVCSDPYWEEEDISMYF